MMSNESNDLPEINPGMLVTLKDFPVFFCYPELRWIRPPIGCVILCLSPLEIYKRTPDQGIRDRFALCFKALVEEKVGLVWIGMGSNDIPSFVVGLDDPVEIFNLSLKVHRNV